MYLVFNFIYLAGSVSGASNLVCNACRALLGACYHPDFVERQCDSLATLIICPTAILNQWVDEIAKHVKESNTLTWRIYK